MPTDLNTTVQRWTQGAGAAQQRYSDGVQNTQVDVVGRAIQAQGALLSNFTQAVNSGRWARKLSEKGTAGWKQATQAKAANYATGIQAGQGNYQQAMSTWLPIIQSAAAQVQTMPSGTLQASIARSTAFMTALYNAKQSQ